MWYNTDDLNLHCENLTSRICCHDVFRLTLNEAHFSYIYHNKTGMTINLVTVVSLYEIIKVTTNTAFHSTDTDIYKAHYTPYYQFNNLNKLCTFCLLLFQMEFCKQGTSKNQRRVCSFVL
jgi:hypothetical protein